jgi:twitching motility protein PilT
LFEAIIKSRASDVHLYPDSAPVFRVDNAVRPSDQHHPLSAEQIMVLIQEIAPDKDWKEFEEHSQCSFTYHQIGLGYARVSAFIKAGVPHCTFRYLPETIPSFDDLNIPADTMKKLGGFHFGLVLVTGMTGSGKSTTVASLIDWINSHYARHILTIEDPIEYVHKNKTSIISQRQVGEDVETFRDAVRAALRQDPDIIFVGEMRDTDTIRSAISAASTGHLVVSTLHANTASEVVTRIVSFFDPVERDLVRLQLRDCVKCIICQRLVAKMGEGRLPALEFLFNDTKYISDSIMAGDAVGIRVGMQQTLTDSFIVEKYLLDMAKQELVSPEEARAHSASPETFDQMRKGNYAPPSLESMKH